ncbi:hypothetical protein [Methylobacterium oxalidis]|uniref:Uncharacterized protein n=1 Tax=Methylobacterium oxalidis TaxID=944322 RepID=A0A512J8Q9_9HYPH|nr:hypothetical protein [Methylobacterium oxalidis]GEP06332.1 hypothetical protein MOX02_43700 [Methylobacterium oxalidis]GJE29914.1 hypothetical protein LDDCCGHA_0077 [Methylobacterium oxalidis]GLS62475.1 hypothetical protein GCM10007888_08560 [Methylobacterium oxalidis]
MPEKLDRALLDAADRDVREAERRRKQQAALVAQLAEQGADEEILLLARRLLLEIERTITIAHAHRSVLRSLIERE